MATKLYLHRATTSDTGTLPAAGVSVSATTPTVIATGGDTNRNMDTTISAVAQTQQDLTTNATTSAQTGLILRFVSAPLAAQTLAIQTVTHAFALSESNTNSVFSPAFVIALWRPSTGALVGYLRDLASPGGGSTTSEVWTTANVATASAQTAVDGDVLVYELWRASNLQTKSTAYTNTYYYDGTTEASSTDAAGYINFPNTITFSAVSPTPPSSVVVDSAVDLAANR